MFIMWGTKVRVKCAGRVADFCPICLSITAFRVDKISEVSHLYFIPVGSGTVLRLLRTCLNCGTWLEAGPSSYARLSSSRTTDVKLLVAETHPDILEEYGKRLELEKQLERGPNAIDQATRLELMREPLWALGPMIEARCTPRCFDRSSATACILTIAIPVLLLIVAVSSEDVTGAVARAENAGADALLVVPLSYTASMTSVLRLAETELPVLVWDTQHADRIERSYSFDDLMMNHVTHEPRDLPSMLLKAAPWGSA